MPLIARVRYYEASLPIEPGALALTARMPSLVHQYAGVDERQKQRVSDCGRRVVAGVRRDRTEIDSPWVTFLDAEADGVRVAGGSALSPAFAGFCPTCLRKAREANDD